MGRRHAEAMNDLVTGIPLVGVIGGLLISLGLNHFAHPIDEVCAVIAGLLVIKAALCLIPPAKQRFDEHGRPYYYHRRSDQQRLVDAVFGYGFCALGVGYTAPLVVNSHPAFGIQTALSAVCLYYIYVKRIIPDLVLGGKRKKDK